MDWDVHPDIDGAEYKPYLPLLYYAGQHRQLFNIRMFFKNQLRGLVHAGITFFITFLSFQNSFVLNADKGYATDLWTSSVCAFTSLVFIVNFNLLIRIKYITYLHALSFVIVSLGLYMIFMWFTNYVYFGWTQYSIYEAHNSILFYLNLALCIGSCLSIDLLLCRLILSVLCRGAVSRVVGRVSNPKSGFILVVLGLLEVPQALTGVSSHFLALISVLSS